MFILVNLEQGPEIRTGFLQDSKPVKLTEGQEITITTDYTIKGDSNMISMSYKKLPVDVKPGNVILCADGTISLMVLSCDPAAGTVRSIHDFCFSLLKKMLKFKEKTLIQKNHIADAGARTRQC